MALGLKNARKYIVLSIFCTLSAVNGFSWLMFDPAKSALESEFSPNFSSSQLTLLSSWQPIMYMLTAPFATAALVKPDGLRKVVKAGCALELLGATLKFLACISTHRMSSLVLLHIGQILSATVSPIAIGTPAELSAVWFPEDQRARATGAAVLANNVGNGIAYLCVPALANAYGYSHVVMMEFCLAVIVISLSWVFLPPQPKHRVTGPKHRTFEEAQAEDTSQVNVLEETKQLFKLPSAVMSCIVYSWSSGGYVAWTSLFDNLLSVRWSDEFIGTLTFVSTVAYVVGGLCSSTLVDSKLRHRMRFILITCCAVSTVSCSLLAVSVPSIFASGQTLVLDGGNGWLYFVFGLTGFCNGAAAPVFYELLAEVAYPISEGVSGNVLSYFENGGSLFLYQGIGNFTSGRAMNIVFAVGMAGCTFLLLFVRSALKRHESEKEQRLGIADLDTFEADGLDDGVSTNADGGGDGNPEVMYERMEQLM